METLQVEQIDGTLQTFVVIKQSDEVSTVMPKSEYDAQQAASDTLPSNSADPETKPAK